MQEIGQKTNLLKHRIAVTYIFLICGVLSGNWVVRIPDIQLKYTLTKGELGLLLTGGPIGAILIMLVVGSLISKFGSKNMTIIGTIAYHGILPILFLMPNSTLMWTSLLFSGIIVTIMDVSMNSQGVEVEREMKKSIISSFHASFSIGGAIGAIIGGIFIGFGFSPEIHLLTVSLASLPISILLLRYLKDSNKYLETTEIKRKLAIKISIPSRNLWLLGIIGFIAVIAEMMMGDWGLLFVLINTNAEANIAALGYAIFSIFMTIGRLSGDFIANKFTTEEIIRTFAVIASGGIILTTLTSEVFIVFLGFAFIGIGLSVLIPIVFKIAGNIQDVETGTGIAGIGLFTSLAGISGPIIIGQIADLFTLKTAFLVIALVLGSIIILSKGLKAKKGAKVLN